MQKDFKFSAEALEKLINRYFIECDERERWYSEAGTINSPKKSIDIFGDGDIISESSKYGDVA